MTNLKCCIHSETTHCDCRCHSVRKLESLLSSTKEALAAAQKDRQKFMLLAAETCGVPTAEELQAFLNVQQLKIGALNEAVQSASEMYETQGKQLSAVQADRDKYQHAAQTIGKELDATVGELSTAQEQLAAKERQFADFKTVELRMYKQHAHDEERIEKLEEALRALSGCMPDKVFIQDETWSGIEPDDTDDYVTVDFETLLSGPERKG